MVILSLSAFRVDYRVQYRRISAEWRLGDEEFEPLYDWLVREALNRSFIYLTGRGPVSDHYRQDIYRCVYDEIGARLEYYLRQEITRHHLDHFRRDGIKALVGGETLVLARGTHHPLTPKEI